MMEAISGAALYSGVSSLPSFREALTLAFRSWKPIALALIIPPVIAVALAFAQTPYYGANAKLLVKAGREYVAPAYSEHTPMAGPSSTMEEQINSEIEILTSRDLLDDVLRDVGIERIFPDIAADPPPGLSIEDAAVKALTTDLKIAPVKLSNVISVTYANPNSDVAVDTLSRLLSGFIARHVQAFSAQRVHLLEGRIADNERHIAELQQARAKFKNDNQLFSAPQQRTVLVNQAEQTLVDLLSAQLQQGELKMQNAYLDRQMAKRPRLASAGVDDQPSPIYQAAQDRVMHLREQRAKLTERLGSAHPLMIENENALRAAEQYLREVPKTTPLVRTGVNPVADQIDGQRISAGTALVPLGARIAALQSRSEEINVRLQGIERNAATLDEMDLQITSMEQDLRILRDSQIRESLDQAQVTNVSIIEEPHGHQKPIRPRKLFFLAVGLAVGAFVAAGILLAALTFGSTFVAVETVERVLGLPVLATVPVIADAACQCSVRAVAADTEDADALQDHTSVITNSAPDTIHPTGAAGPMPGSRQGADERSFVNSTPQPQSRAQLSQADQGAPSALAGSAAATMSLAAVVPAQDASAEPTLASIGRDAASIGHRPTLLRFGLVTAGISALAAGVVAWPLTRPYLVPSENHAELPAPSPSLVEPEPLAIPEPARGEPPVTQPMTSVRGDSVAAVDGPALESEVAPVPAAIAPEGSAPPTPSEKSELLARGNDLMTQSDVVSARLLYGYAATRGSVSAMTAMGRTYDPVFFTRSGTRGVRPELAKAIEWYERAIDGGDAEAKRHLRDLAFELRDASGLDPTQAAALLRKTK